MSVSYFPYPLQFGALEEFCHPAPTHVLSRPAYHNGEALAGNGYIMIRAHRGLWMASDFRDPLDGFLNRFFSPPWKDPETLSKEWLSIDEIKGNLFRFGVRGPWLKGRCAPSPVWRVGGAFLARQSHLQMIARLPRCEVTIPKGRVEERPPLYFRFSGGHGIFANDPKLNEWSFAVFNPIHCPMTREEIKRESCPKPNFGQPPPPEPPIDDWPPAGA